MFVCVVWMMLTKERQMGSESSSSSPSGKRGRDPEEEIYLDNLHSSKRYLSEIMASSLNGLTVGDNITENLMESPLRSDCVCYPRDEVTSPYSPMSEDSDESRYSDTLQACTSHNDSVMSPASPYRHQRSCTGFSSTVPTTSYPSVACSLASVNCPQPRQRNSDSEGRFPSSPSDICHTGDLRRAALLRSVQMRVQPQSPPADILCGGGHEHDHEPDPEPVQNVDHLEEEKSLETKYQRGSKLLDETPREKMSDSQHSKEML